MFGLEKKQRGIFEYDLERDLKKDAKKRESFLKIANERAQEIKSRLKTGSESSKQLEDYGTLLHGYTALKKVIEKLK